MNRPKIVFAQPIVCSICHVAGASEKAFINLRPIEFSCGDKHYTLPAFFISDGLSIPDLLQWKIQGEDGICGGHVHDILYSQSQAQILKEIATDLGCEEKEAADYLLQVYLEQRCPGIRKIEAWSSRIMVILFGGSSFQAAERDAWRNAVALRLGGLPGDGCGVKYYHEDLLKSVMDIISSD